MSDKRLDLNDLWLRGGEVHECNGSFDHEACSGSDWMRPATFDDLVEVVKNQGGTVLEARHGPNMWSEMHTLMPGAYLILGPLDEEEKPDA